MVPGMSSPLALPSSKLAGGVGGVTCGEIDNTMSIKIQDSRLNTAQRGNTTQTRDPGEHHRPLTIVRMCYGTWAREWPRRLRPHTPVCCKPDRLAYICCAQSPYQASDMHLPDTVLNQDTSALLIPAILR